MLRIYITYLCGRETSIYNEKNFTVIENLWLLKTKHGHRSYGNGNGS